MKEQRASAVKRGSSRERILRSAERLFAAKGFHAVSVRDMADDAGVNSALIGYYFGSKEGLLADVYTRHCQPLNAERELMLNEARANGRKPSLADVLLAFLRPSLRGDRSRGNTSFSRLRAMLAGENSSLLEQLIAKNFDQSTELFVDALCECLPALSREDVLWRFHFLLGAMQYTATGPRRIRILSHGKCDPANTAAAEQELMQFASAAFQAPPVVRLNASAPAAKPTTSPKMPVA